MSQFAGRVHAAVAACRRHNPDGFIDSRKSSLHIPAALLTGLHLRQPERVHDQTGAGAFYSHPVPAMTCSRIPNQFCAARRALE